MRGRAVSQIQVHKALIRDTRILRYRLKIAGRFFVMENRDFLFELGCIQILFRSGEIVFFAHVTPFTDGTWILWYLLCEPR